MTALLLLVTHERCTDHDGGAHHPERPARLGAALAGIHDLHLDTDLLTRPATPAPTAALLRVHDPGLLEQLEALDELGGGPIDPDTAMGPHSWEAARMAAGAGLVALDALDQGEANTAFCIVRPPGHHATPTRSMGFCLLNNVAVLASALADRGDRPVIVDFDAHHGNGTQDAFYADPRVLFVSFHQWPLYPGTGRADEIGRGEGRGFTVNLPVPPHATGDVYRRAWEEVVLPVLERFGPTHLLLSAGFDSHRADPLTDLGLSCGDFATLTAEIISVVPAGRCIAFLEGGYDLEVLRRSTAATAAALVGESLVEEPPSGGGPGRELIEGWRLQHRESG